MIQLRDDDNELTDFPCLCFRPATPQEIQASEIQEGKKFEPKRGDKYWMVKIGSGKIEVTESYYHEGGEYCHIKYFKMGNCFKTKAEADRYKEAIEAILKLSQATQEGTV